MNTTTLPLPELDLSAFMSRKTEGLDFASMLEAIPAMSPGDTAMAVASAVRECVVYKPIDTPMEGTTAANCIGFTLLMSEALERKEIDQRMVFCNHHMFNLVVEASQVHMIHAESREFWQRDLGNNPIASRMLKSHELAAVVDQTESIDYYSLGTERLANNVNNPPAWLKAWLPAAAVMLLEPGREAVAAYTEFSRALNSGEVASVNAALLNVKDHNPQIETRPTINDDLRLFRAHISRWSNETDAPTEELSTAITRYEAAMPVKTKSLAIFIGDCLRRVGAARTKSELLDAALDAYAEAHKKSDGSHDPTLRGKVEKTKAVRQKCLSDEQAKPSSRQPLVLSS